MLGLLLAVALAGVPEDEFDLTVQGMARRNGCEVQAIMASDSGDLRVVTFSCLDLRVGVVWIRVEGGWEIAGKVSTPLPPMRGSAEL